VFRQGGHALQVSWTARVSAAESGSFTLYRRQGSRQITVAKVPGRSGQQTYRIEDGGNLDSSADYELRWRSETGEESVVGALRCERDSSCKPLHPQSQRNGSFLEQATGGFSGVLWTRGEPLNGEPENRPFDGFVSSSHPPPRRGS
jgi:hypothetical protein